MPITVIIVYIIINFVLITIAIFIPGTFCGVFRRQALDRGAMLVRANKIVTGACLDFI